MPKVKFNTNQRNTVSKAAAKMIEKFTGFDLPNFIPITNKMIFRMRQQFQDGEDKIEEQIIADNKLSVKPVNFGGTNGLLIEAADVKRDQGIIINVHGGGFIMGTSRDRNGLLAAAETHLPVYSVEYTLAPEAAAPTALNEVEKFYSALGAQFYNQPIYMTGSSAGSTIVASALVRMHKKAIPMPSAIILFCPALDISGDGDSAVFNGHRDALSTHLSLRLAQRYIGEHNPHSADISPLYAEIGPWFPPTFMTTGTRDMMLSNVLRFTEKLKQANVPNGYIIKEGMWHGFNWEPKLPEAIETRNEAWAFLQKYSK